MKRKLEALGAALATAAVTVGIAVAASTPAVVTGSVTAVADTTANLHGTVNPEGSTTAYNFQWGLTSAYGLSSPVHSAGNGTKAVSVATVATALIPGTTYHYRVVAGNHYGSALGGDHTFKTSGHPPALVATGPSFAVDHTSAVVSGAINPNGESTGWAFQYGPTPAYGSQTFGGSLAPSTSVQGVSEKIVGLSSGVTFHYRLIAIHTNSTISYGSDETFTTLPSPRPLPVVHARTLPSRVRHKPYVFAILGSVVPPASIPASVSCNGIVAVRFFLGHQSRALATTAVKPDCTFAALVVFHRLIGNRGHSTRLRVEVRFRGNAYLESKSAPVQRVHLG